jgi:type II restriction/modification system DNA methylase subunit YeeA
MTVTQFIEKWQKTTLSERASAQEHFIDLCRMLGHPTPAEADPTGESYTFERHVQKTTGGKGFADVWKRSHFAWEYKGKRKDLEQAYSQLLLYREDLDNPPLLIVSDIDSIEIHTNFTDTTKKVYTLTLAELAKPDKYELLKLAFTNPQGLNPKERRERITEDAAARIGSIAHRLRERGYESETVAHFMMQLVFALFAEDIRLIPNRLVTKILERYKDRPDTAQKYLAELFSAMATGGDVLFEEVPYFNGGLFAGGDTLRLESDELVILLAAANLDWGEVEPAIFGTLFERSLDPQKRSQLGAHYTSREDILRIVEPVIMAPLREEWEAIRQEVETRLERGHSKKVLELVATFLNKLHQLKVLDPACGSGNFLYVAMQQLKDLEKEVVTLAQSIGAPGFMLIGPAQFYGLELSVFAHELASTVVWIGYLQWNRANGVSNQEKPILKKLETIRLHDALMNDDGSEFDWPEADFIVGNPPFLGGKKVRRELGDEYVDRLFSTYDERVPREADLVTYWFEKARAHIETGKTKRAGLIATNSIRGGANRKVLERIKTSGDIFMAWSDEPWVLDGAAVRVSIIGIDKGSQSVKLLNGLEVATINPDLTSSVNVSQAKSLVENTGKSFMGTTKVGPFEIEGSVARTWLTLSNPGGCNNADVVKPWINGLDVTRKPRDMWIVDFGLMSEDEASAYVVPYEYLRENVKPIRMTNNRSVYREKWWLHAEPRPALRQALKDLNSYIVTPRVAKHRFFMRLPADYVPDSRLFVFALSNAEFGFGVLSSKIHEVWTLATCSWHGVGNDPTYNTSTCFETFPFPHPDPTQHTEIEKWAKYLDDIRRQILAADDSLTMTKLYNEVEKLRETRDSSSYAYPLLIAHEKLDAAVAAAYGWEWPLEDEMILQRLLELNLERAKAE